MLKTGGLASFYIGNYTEHGIGCFDENLRFLSSCEDFCGIKKIRSEIKGKEKAKWL